MTTKSQEIKIPISTFHLPDQMRLIIGHTKKSSDLQKSPSCKIFSVCYQRIAQACRIGQCHVCESWELRQIWCSIVEFEISNSPTVLRNLRPDPSSNQSSDSGGSQWPRLSCQHLVRLSCSAVTVTLAPLFCAIRQLTEK
jgi:hypothetical protein